MPRFLVLEEAGPDAAGAAARELAGGRTPVPGWDRARPGALHVGTVAERADAARAVLAAVAGADLVITAAGPREVVDQLCEDLRRLGRLEHRVGGAPGAPLAPEERALLALLLTGASLGEAARRLHVSRRTADRRLAGARRALGARSTSEALVLARRHGVEPG